MYISKTDSVTCVEQDNNHQTLRHRNLLENVPQMKKISNEINNKREKQARLKD